MTTFAEKWNLNEKDMYILDYINSSIYENLQMTLLDNENKIYSFYDSTSLYDLIKKYNTKDIKEILQKEFNELSQNIKLIDITNDVSTFEILTRDEFNEKYGFDLDITYKTLSLKNFSSGIFDESMIKMNDFDDLYVSFYNTEQEQQQANTKRIQKLLKKIYNY